MPKIKKDARQLQALKEVSDSLELLRRYRIILDDESIPCTVSFQLKGDKQPMTFSPGKGLERQIRLAVDREYKAIAANIVKTVGRYALELDEDEMQLVGLTAPAAAGDDHKEDASEALNADTSSKEPESGGYMPDHSMYRT